MVQKVTGLSQGIDFSDGRYHVKVISVDITIALV